jgi:hypothetical protein
MSLAMTAASLDNDNNVFTNESPINRKRTHNKTQKRIISGDDFNSSKVKSVLESIHNMTADDDDLDTFTPARTNFQALEPPRSAGVERASEKQAQQQTQQTESFTNNDTSLAPQPMENEYRGLQTLESNYMNDAQVKEYYKKLMPNYEETMQNPKNNQKPYYRNEAMTMAAVTGDSNQVLIDKLNYMINLLEEQQDQKTNSVTEEVVLYSFLGVFMIFIVDSFARVGKYTR